MACPGRGTWSRSTSHVTASDASDTTATDVPSSDSASGKGASATTADEDAPRARHRTCADVAPSQVDTLVIKRLATGLQEAELLRHLEEQGHAAGSAVSAKLLRCPKGSSCGTAFVRFATPESAQAALEELSARPHLGGRRAHVELQKSKALLGGRELEALLSEKELDAVRMELERFVRNARMVEVALPSQFSSHQRKYAHSLAEQHGFGHSSRQGPDSATCVYLTKAAQVSADVVRPPPGLDPNDIPELSLEPNFAWCHREPQQ